MQIAHTLLLMPHESRFRDMTTAACKRAGEYCLCESLGAGQNVGVLSLKEDRENGSRETVVLLRLVARKIIIKYLQ